MRPLDFLAATGNLGRYQEPHFSRGSGSDGGVRKAGVPVRSSALWQGASQPAPGHLPPVPGVVLRPALAGRHRMVIGPGDPVPGQHVKDGPGRRVVEQIIGRVVDKAVGCPRDKKTAVRESGTQARAKPVIGQRESPAPAPLIRPSPTVPPRRSPRQSNSPPFSRPGSAEPSTSPAAARADPEPFEPAARLPLHSPDLWS